MRNLLNPELQKNLTRVFFGATVSYEETNVLNTVQLVGIDEADLTKNKISWTCPVAKALLKSQVGDIIEINTPAGIKILKILDIKY